MLLIRTPPESLTGGHSMQALTLRPVDTTSQNCEMQPHLTEVIVAAEIHDERHVQTHPQLD